MEAILKKAEEIILQVKKGGGITTKLKKEEFGS
jgi:hypothetical protein